MPRTQSVNVSPFAPVELQPLLTADGDKTNRCAVILDPDGIREQVGVVSNDYKLISNRAVIDAAEEIIRNTDLQFKDHHTMWNGKQFRRRYILPDLVREVQVGDVVALALDIRNSFNGSLTVGIAFNMLRLECENGLICCSLLGGFALKHLGDKNFETELNLASESILNLGQRLDNILPVFSEMTRKGMDRADIQQFFRKTDLPMSSRAKIFDSIVDDSQWAVYNSATELFTQADTFHAENMNRKVSDYFLMGQL